MPPLLPLVARGPPAVVIVEGGRRPPRVPPPGFMAARRLLLFVEEEDGDEKTGKALVVVVAAVAPRELLLPLVLPRIDIGSNGLYRLPLLLPAKTSPVFGVTCPLPLPPPPPPPLVLFPPRDEWAAMVLSSRDCCC